MTIMTTRGNGNYGEDAILDWRCVWEARFHYLLDIITIYIYAVCIVGLRDVLISFYLFFFSFHCASSSAVIQLYVRLGTIGKGKKKKGLSPYLEHSCQEKIEFGEDVLRWLLLPS